MPSFIENVNVLHSKLGVIEAVPQYIEEISVNMSATAAYKESAASSAALAQSSAVSSAQSLSESVRTKDELVAMKESFGLAVRTESATVMLDGFGRYFIQASLTPYGDVLVATVDDGDNDIDIIDGVVSDRELKRFYFTDESLLGKTIVFKYLGSAINTPLSQYLKDTVDALELLDYKASIDAYASIKTIDTQSQIDTFIQQKSNDISTYANGISTTTQLLLDTTKSDVIAAISAKEEEAQIAADAISVSLVNANTARAELDTFATSMLENIEVKNQNILAASQDALIAIDTAKAGAMAEIVEASGGISVDDVITALGTFSEFDAALS